MTQTGNLAYACFACNRGKGSDIASLVPGTARLAPLFHPRHDRWHEHFGLSKADGVTIVPVSDIGEVTARLLRINDPDRLVERQALRAALRYPIPAVMRRLTGAM